jgi:hypothetical protein
MNSIVLITREEEGLERPTHAAVYLGNGDALGFCRFVNRMELADGRRLRARPVRMGYEYRVERVKPFRFEDIAEMDDRRLQYVIRDFDRSELRLALCGADEALCQKIFVNMPRREAAMLKEDIEFSGPQPEDFVSQTREHFTAVCEERLFAAKMFAWTPDSAEDFTNPQAVLALAGREDVETITVLLCQDEKSARNFCDMINNQPQEDGRFCYARIAAQLCEYELRRPVLARFEQLLDDNFTNWAFFQQALRIAGVDTVVCAMRGTDRETRKRILLNLPPDRADAIRDKYDKLAWLDTESLKRPKKFWQFWPVKDDEILQAQRKIVDLTNWVAKKAKKENAGEVLKD